MTSGSETRKRPHILPIRLSDEERETLAGRAQAANRSVAGYVRAVALEQSPRTRDTMALIAALSRVGNNLNQLAKQANRTGHVEAAEALKPVLADLRAIMEGLA